MDAFFTNFASSVVDGGYVGFSPAEFFVSITLSAFLSIIICLIYRYTHTGLSYSRTFVLTMIIMSITVSFIMLIIGSNLARAFSLVGALSIIRFRNAVKDSRDTGYIFLTMAIGMACGTKIYLMAIIFTILSSIILVLLNRFYFGTNSKEERLVQFSFSENQKLTQNITDYLDMEYRNRYSLLSSEILDGKNILVYNIELDNKIMDANELNKIRSMSKNLDVKLLTGFEKFNF
tara:strand:- start:9 stop:707 length:699 start_codon:yes stop_codon:yes gene_type:complete